MWNKMFWHLCKNRLITGTYSNWSPTLIYKVLLEKPEASLFLMQLLLTILQNFTQYFVLLLLRKIHFLKSINTCKILSKIIKVWAWTFGSKFNILDMRQILDPRDNFIHPHDPLKSRNFLIHAAQLLLNPITNGTHVTNIPTQPTKCRTLLQKTTF